MKPTVFICFILTIVGMFSAGYGIASHNHTCPTTYPTRNEMLIHLRQWGYKGPLDNKIGTGGNDAWDNKDEATWKKKANQTAIEYYGAGEPK